MALDAQDPAILALLVERIEQLTGDMKEVKELVGHVRLNTHQIGELKKETSGHHKKIEEVTTFATGAKSASKVLYAVILIFSGAMTTATGVAIGLFFKDSNAIASLTAQMQEIRMDVNILLGEKK